MRTPDPILNKETQLIIEDGILADSSLCERMKQDLSIVPRSVMDRALKAMLRMHKQIAEECGDLDVSLSTTDEIADHTEPQYVILDEQSSDEDRFIRLHYRADWETFHGVEVIIRNGANLLFVGNCGYICRIGTTLSAQDQQSNYMDF